MNDLIFTKELIKRYFNDEKYFIDIYKIDENILEKISRLHIQEIIVVCNAVLIGKEIFKRHFTKEIRLENALRFSYEANFENLQKLYKRKTKRELITQELKTFLEGEN